MRPSSPLPASLAFQETTPPSWGGVLAGGSGVRRPKLPLLGAQVLVVVVGGVRGGLVLPARGGRRTAVEASRGSGGGFALRKGATFFFGKWMRYCFICTNCALCRGEHMQNDTKNAGKKQINTTNANWMHIPSKTPLINRFSAGKDCEKFSLLWGILHHASVF